MSEIIYRPIRNTSDSVVLFLLTEVTNEKSEKLILKITDARQGYVKIDSQKYKIKNGTVEIDFSNLTDGLIEPRIVIGTKSIFAMPFLKNGDSINKIPIGDEAYRIIDKAFSELFVRLTAAESKIFQIEEKMQPLNLFSF